VSFSVSELAALESGVIRIGVFFRMATLPDPVRLWLGVGVIEPGVNVLDTSGARYLGFGEIRDVPNFKQLLNGTAERVDFTLSGVAGEVLSIASQNDAQAIKGKSVNVGYALMAPDWSLLGAVRFRASYLADYLGLDQQEAGSSDDPIVRSIRLSCGTTFTARWRPQYSYFSDRDQQARSPGDRFCERTAIYANGFNKAWPTFPS
jgi:hypothetical protein